MSEQQTARSDVPVRLATRADASELLAMCRELHAENGLGAMDEDMVVDVLERTFDKRGGIVGVIDGKSGIEAAICMLITSIWYHQEHHIEELFSFVRVPYRKSNHSLTLVNFAKKCSDTLGIPLLVGIITNQMLEQKARLYRRRLGPPSGALFVYGAKWVGKPASDKIWNGLLHDENIVPKGARIVSRDKLETLGDGNADRGWEVLDRYIKRKIGKTSETMLPGLQAALSTAISTAQFSCAGSA